MADYFPGIPHLCECVVYGVGLWVTGVNVRKAKLFSDIADRNVFGPLGQVLDDVVV